MSVKSDSPIRPGSDNKRHFHHQFPGLHARMNARNRAGKRHIDYATPNGNDCATLLAWRAGVWAVNHRCATLNPLPCRHRPGIGCQ